MATAEGPYRVLDTRKRRSAGIVYLVMGAIGAGIIVLAGISLMWLTAVVPLVAVAGYQFVCAWPMKVGDNMAIELSAAAVSFPFGHGSASLGYSGWLARPVWQVLVFAAGAAPDHQGLVTIDAGSGEVTGLYEEQVEQP
ncbi:MAG: hypothetical protein ACR2N7_04700 [Acidimicrobiia bacterium]